MTLLSALTARLEAGFPNEYPDKLAVAVSGGGDSLALMHLAAHWARTRKVRLSVVTVDHGLRAESAREADLVARQAARRDLLHQTLRWQGWDRQGNLQDAARTARRRLIEDWAAGQGIGVILTGHTADDQAETVLMRLARGSGVDGLAGIAPQTQHGVLWMRPLLGCQRADLRDYLRNQGIEWVDDPSNDDPRFDRVKARQMMDTLGDLGLTVPRLAETARHMQAAQQVLETATISLARAAVTQEHGDLLIECAVFAAAAAETRTRLLARALCWVSGTPYRPRFAPLSELARRPNGTLHGCQIAKAGDRFRIFREYQAVRDITCDTSEMWDSRWRLEGPESPGLTIGALGPEGAQHCPDRHAAPFPHASLLSGPAIWRDNRLVAAPLAGLGNGWRAKLAQDRADFHESFNSH